MVTMISGTRRQQAYFDRMYLKSKLPGHSQ